jgi:hypothetical protein
MPLADAEPMTAARPAARQGVFCPVPIRPPNTRLGRREPDLLLLQNAPERIAEYTRILDQRLTNEQRPSERTRMLRETTNQITRTANDAIQAYHRARASVAAELEMSAGDHAHAKRMSGQLEVARKDVLAALETARIRYPNQIEPEADAPIKI